MIRAGIASLREFRNLALAREFILDSTDFNYSKNWIEKLGDAALAPLFLPTDFCFRNIQNPLFILAMMVSAIAMVSIGFYPNQFFAVASTAFPFMKSIRPGQARFALYLLAQITTTGLGLRTFGRQSNKLLMEAFQNRQIQPLFMGTIKV